MERVTMEFLKKPFVWLAIGVVVVIVLGFVVSV